MTIISKTLKRFKIYKCILLNVMVGKKFNSFENHKNFKRDIIKHYHHVLKIFISVTELLSEAYYYNVSYCA